MTLRKYGYFFLISLLIAVGCSKTKQAESSKKTQKHLLTVDFEEGKTLRYNFVSDRDITINWDPTSEKAAKQLDKSKEHFEMIVAYTPIEVDPYGLTKLMIVCESISLNRTPSKGVFVDAALKFIDRPFLVSVTPNGRLVDTAEFEKVISELGMAAFRSQAKANIKEPDMLNDIIASQWFMWETIAGIPYPANGVDINDQWETVSIIPSPIVTTFAKKATHTFAEIRETPKGQMAVIKSEYSPGEVPSNLPAPYKDIDGKFQMAGKFGFLGGFKLLSLEGVGEEVFNIERGVLEAQNQQYVTKLQAAPLMGLPVKPHITIEQKFVVKLVEDGPK